MFGTKGMAWHSRCYPARRYLEIGVQLYNRTAARADVSLVG